MEVSLKGIIFEKDKKYKIVDDVNFYMNLVDFSNINHDSILFVNMIQAYHTEFGEFPFIEEFIETVNKIKEERYISVIVYILNETCVKDTTQFDTISHQTKLNYFISNYDLFFNKDIHLFYPASMCSQLEYLNDNDFESGKSFLMSMNQQYHNLQKPYKCAFYSKHINPIRIDIFNILKKYNVLKDSTWSFHKLEEYYSGERHDLNEFYKENEGLIPYSFDYYSDDRSNLKHTYFSQWMCYFEILTESYFLRYLDNKNDYCPMTEKIVKPIVSGLPFIIFCPKKLREGLENIGMTFNSPLYGFYDISSDSEIELGLKHIEKQVSMPKEDLHELYFEYIEEYHRNLEMFLSFFKQNSEKIKGCLQNID